MENYKTENSKEKILKAAVKLFAQKGFDGVSIREICKEADINVCMVSYYFGGKKELYQGIIDNLIERQTKFAKTFIDIDKDISGLSYHEKAELLLLMTDKFIDFFYANFTGDLIVLLLKEQQKPDFMVNSPVLNYFRKLVAELLHRDINDKKVIFKTLFLIAQINSPAILPAFSLRLLGQNEFIQEDIKIIKANLKFYIKAMLKEEAGGEN